MPDAHTRGRGCYLHHCTLQVEWHALQLATEFTTSTKVPSPGTQPRRPHCRGMGRVLRAAEALQTRGPVQVPHEVSQVRQTLLAFVYFPRCTKLDNCPAGRRMGSTTRTVCTQMPWDLSRGYSFRAGQTGITCIGRAPGARKAVLDSASHCSRLQSTYCHRRMLRYQHEAHPHKWVCMYLGWQDCPRCK